MDTQMSNENNNSSSQTFGSNKIYRNSPPEIQDDEPGLPQKYKQHGKRLKKPDYEAAGTQVEQPKLVLRNKRRLIEMQRGNNFGQAPTKRMQVDVQHEKAEKNMHETLELAEGLLAGIEEQASGFAMLNRKIVSVRRYLHSVLKSIRDRKAKKELTVKELDRRLGNIRQ
jgi:hypothetical protein